MTFDHKMQIINSIGTWFSGIVTFFAVAITYLIGTRSQRVYVRKFMRISHIVMGSGPSPKLIHINVANTNDIPLCLNSVIWVIKRKSKILPSVLTLSFYPVSGTMPATINPGHSSDFFIGLDQFVDEARSNWFSTKALSKRALKSLTANITTSTGKTIEIQSPPELIEILMKSHDDIRINE